MQFNNSSQLTQPFNRTRAYLVATLAGMLLLATKSFSQEPQDNSEEALQEDRWYQVEVIIFARTYVPLSHQETWDKNAPLAYPPHWVELSDLNVPIDLNSDNNLPLNTAFPYQDNPFATPGQFNNYTNLETPTGTKGKASSTQDTELVGSLQPDIVEQEAQTEEPATTDLPGSEETNRSTDGNSTGDTSENESTPAIRMPDPARDPFYKLPKDTLELNPLAQDLRRKSGYRVLFHEAWRQPVQSEETAKSVLINGGKTYGEHTELEGSLKISVSRYLHIHTNLWFAEFIPNFGQNIENWPQLPAKPQVNVRPSTTDNILSPNVNTTDYSEPVLDNEYSKIISQPYVIDQLYTLKQRRRMRSGELHYIDHPVLGLLIKVIPYDYQDTTEENIGQNEEAEASSQSATSEIQ